MSSISRQLDDTFRSLDTSFLPAFAQTSLKGLRSLSVNFVASVEKEVESYKNSTTNFNQLVVKVAKVAATTMAFCCYPLASTAGALAGILLKNEIQLILKERQKETPLRKSIDAVQCLVIAVIVPQVFCGAAIAAGVSNTISALETPGNKFREFFN